jgi:hypothetical protein
MSSRCHFRLSLGERIEVRVLREICAATNSRLLTFVLSSIEEERKICKLRL